MSTLSLDLASAPSDRQAAFRLRYSVYVAEQGKQYREANHRDAALTDALDASADILIVRCDDEVVGTLRANWFSSPVTHAAYAEQLEIHRFRAFQDRQLVLCSRLAVAPAHRHSDVRSLLFEGIYRHALALDTRVCFATCAPIVLRLFRRYGFRGYADPVRDPAVGTLHRTALLLHDLEHLERVGSPFLPIALGRGIQARSVHVDTR